MSLVIPRTRIASVSLRPVLFSGDQEGTLGGPSLPVPRIGDRWAVDVATTQLRNDAEGRELIAAVTQALTEDGLISIGQPNLDAPVNAGAAVIDGASQGGSVLKIRGIRAGAALPRGLYFSIVHAGRRYVHMTTAAGAVSGAGKIQIGIWPMLRFLTVDGESCEIDDPKIEGKVSGFDKGAPWVRNRTDPISFSIGERA